jgi:hypothetical protein
VFSLLSATVLNSQVVGPHPQRPWLTSDSPYLDKAGARAGFWECEKARLWTPIIGSRNRNQKLVRIPVTDFPPGEAVQGIDWISSLVVCAQWSQCVLSSQLMPTWMQNWPALDFSGPCFLYLWSFDQKVQLYIKNDSIVIIACFLLTHQRSNGNHAIKAFYSCQLSFLVYR